MISSALIRVIVSQGTVNCAEGFGPYSLYINIFFIVRQNKGAFPGKDVSEYESISKLVISH